jgi:hypothetical protein
MKNIEFEDRFVNQKRKRLNTDMYSALNRCLLNDNQKKLQSVQSALQIMKQAKSSKRLPAAYKDMKMQIMLGVENLIKLAEASNVFSGYDEQAEGNGKQLGQSNQATTAASQPSPTKRLNNQHIQSNARTLLTIAGTETTTTIAPDQIVLGELGQARCPAGYREASAEKCYEYAAQALPPGAILAPKSSMKVGVFTTVPDGCSISVRDGAKGGIPWTDGWTVFFNSYAMEVDQLLMRGCDSPLRDPGWCDYSAKVCVASQEVTAGDLSCIVSAFLLT